jgi:hypothetical protein
MRKRKIHKRRNHTQKILLHVFYSHIRSSIQTESEVTNFFSEEGTLLVNILRDMLLNLTETMY